MLNSFATLLNRFTCNPLDIIYYPFIYTLLIDLINNFLLIEVV